MNEVISQLNRNTVLKFSGQTPDANAMNQFGNVILKHIDRISFDSQYNLIENMLCFDGLSEELKKVYEEKRKNLSRKLSFDNLSKDDSLMHEEEVGAMKI